MSRNQLFLLCLALSATSFVLVQSKSLGDDAEQPTADSSNRIDGPEETEVTSSTQSEPSTTTTTTTSIAEISPTEVPHNFTASVIRALEVLKASFAQDLKFETVKKARKFVKYAHLLPSYLAALEADNQFVNKEMIAEMRKAMEEPRFKVGEQVSRRTMNKYRPLDRDLYKRPLSLEEAAFTRSSSSRYLRSLELLASLKKRMDKDTSVKQILGHVYEMKRSPMVESLLEHATADTRSVLQRSEMEKNNKLGCQIEILHPVCNLTATPIESPQIPDTNELLKLKQMSPTQLRERLGEAKVDPEVMRSVCEGVRKNFKNISMIRKYENAKVFEEGQLSNKLKEDLELNFYYQLYDLCEPSKLW